MNERANEPAYPAPENMDGKWLDPLTCKQWSPYSGLTIREHFAGLLGKDAEECAYSTLSRAAKAILVGRESPPEPHFDANPSPAHTAAVMEYQIAAYRWELDVRAVMRRMAADALIAALNQEQGK